MSILVPGFYVAFDLQRDANPAYNHDRGPVIIYSIRLHMALGLKPWLRQQCNRSNDAGVVQRERESESAGLREGASRVVRRAAFFAGACR
jgi:hypothetical protein